VCKRLVKQDAKVDLRIPQTFLDQLEALAAAEGNALAPLLRRLLSIGYAIEARRGQL
jgi:hypothetical protein